MRNLNGTPTATEEAALAFGSLPLWFIGGNAGATQAEASTKLLGETGGAAKTSTSFTEGSFSVFNWKGYPVGGVKPMGPFRLLEGAEYTSARNLANSTNAAMRRANPEMFKGVQIHEIHPVKFGGSPTDLSNKVFLTPEQHRLYNTFWFKLQNSIK